MKALSTALVSWVALLAIFVTAVPAAFSQSGARESINLHIALTRSGFIGVNEGDAKAAFKVFAMRIGEKRGYDVTPYVSIFDDVAELATEIGRDTQDLVILDTWDYLTYAPFTNMPVEFVAIEQGVIVEPYVLLARADRGISGISDLKGKHVIVLESCNANNCRNWLRTELLALGLADPQAFFQRMEIKEKVSQVVLPVFFGKADACVVDRSGFVIMSEMNPEVGKTLSVLAHSEPYLDSICCVRQSGWEQEQNRSDLLAALEEIPEDPAGKQIMETIQVQRFWTVRRPLSRHDTRAARASRRAGKGTGPG